MGRSMAEITPELVRTMPASAEVYDEKLDRHFEVHSKDGKLYQSEYQTDADGKDIFRDSHALDWIIGAGMNGFGALLARDGYLFQAPLSYYSKSAKWGSSPGYEFGDYGFNRPVLAACISCHSGRPRPIAATNGRYASEPFRQLPIGCENCHGPGAAHIRDVESGDSSGKGQPIVNPADLTMELSNNICMSCHELGDERVFREGKTYQDFRPGQPLDDVLSILMVPPTRETPPQADHLEHYYSMTLSKCYRASGGPDGLHHLPRSARGALTRSRAHILQCKVSDLPYPARLYPYRGRAGTSYTAGRRSGELHWLPYAQAGCESDFALQRDQSPHSGAARRRLP